MCEGYAALQTKGDFSLTAVSAHTSPSSFFCILMQHPYSSTLYLFLSETTCSCLYFFALYNYQSYQPPLHTHTHTPTLRTMLYSSSPQSLITLLFISLSYFHFPALSSLCLVLLFHIISVSPIFSLPHPLWHVPSCLPPFVGLMLDTFPSPLTCSTSYYECHMPPC